VSMWVLWVMASMRALSVCVTRHALRVTSHTSRTCPSCRGARACVSPCRTIRPAQPCVYAHAHTHVTHVNTHTRTHVTRVCHMSHLHQYLLRLVWAPPPQCQLGIAPFHRRYLLDVQHKLQLVHLKHVTRHTSPVTRHPSRTISTAANATSAVFSSFSAMAIVARQAHTMPSFTCRHSSMAFSHSPLATCSDSTTG
jgi:hypothetical protein